MHTPLSTRVDSVTRKQGRHSLIRLRDPGLAAPRPGQYLRVDGAAWPVIAVTPGAIDCLAPLAAPSPGSSVSLVGPLGEGFEPRPGRALLLGDGAGLAPLVFLAGVLSDPGSALALLQFDGAPPLRLRPSRLLVAGMPPAAIATVGLLEDSGIACRVSGAGEQPGCSDLPPAALARRWLASAATLPTVYACGGPGLLADARELARNHHLHLQAVAAEWPA